MSLLARGRIVARIGLAVEHDERHDHGRCGRRDLQGASGLEPGVAVELEVAQPVSIPGLDDDLEQVHATVAGELGQVREEVRVEQVRDCRALRVTADIVAAQVGAVSRDPGGRIDPYMRYVEDWLLSDGRDQRRQCVLGQRTRGVGEIAADDAEIEAAGLAILGACKDVNVHRRPVTGLVRVRDADDQLETPIEERDLVSVHLDGTEHGSLRVQPRPGLGEDGPDGVATPGPQAAARQQRNDHQGQRSPHGTSYPTDRASVAAEPRRRTWAMSGRRGRVRTMSSRGPVRLAARWRRRWQ